MNLTEQQLVQGALAGARKSGRNGWFRADCPFCDDVVGKPDRRQSLAIKPSIEFFKCLRCGTRGRVQGDEVDALVAAEAATLLKHSEDPRPKKIPPPEGYEPLGDEDAWTCETLTFATNYLRRRGVTRDTVFRAQVGVTYEGKFRNRIIVPVLDSDEETWLGFSARDLTGQARAKYLYPEGMDRGKVLYNIAAIDRATDEPVICVEGVFDALPYFPDVVGFLGKPVETHLALLLDSARPIAICLDGDAHDEGWAVAEMLKFQGLRAGAVRLPAGRDPNTVDPAWLREQARRCVQ